MVPFCLLSSCSFTAENQIVVNSAEPENAYVPHTLLLFLSIVPIVQHNKHNNNKRVCVLNNNFA